MGRRKLCSLLAAGSVWAIGCHRNGRVDASLDGGAAKNASPDMPRCTAEGLGTARLVSTWKPSEACHWRALAHGATTIMRSEADLVAGALDCPASSGVDFAKYNVVVAGRALLPATLGVDVYDDGQKVTFVSRQRDSCPNEYPPTPITVPIAFLIPSGQTRTFAEASCKQAWKCP